MVNGLAFGCVLRIEAEPIVSANCSMLHPRLSGLNDRQTTEGRKQRTDLVSSRRENAA